MIRNRLPVGILSMLTLCVFTLSPLYGMQESVSKYVNPHSFLFQLAALCVDNKVDTARFLTLVDHIHTDAVAQELNIDTESIKNYIDTDKFSELIKLCPQKGHEASKADALFHSFKIEALERRLQCTELKKIIKPLSRLYFFNGDDEDKEDLLNKLKRALTYQIENGSDELKQFLDLEKVKELVDAALGGAPLVWQQVFGALSTESLPVGPYLHIGNLIPLIAKVLKRDTPTVLELVNCIRWDTLLMHLPRLLGQSNEVIPALFAPDRLKAQIQLFQNRQALTADGLKNTLNQEAFGPCTIPYEEIDNYIDFEALAEGLNNLRKGLPAPELKEAFNLERIELKTGLDLRAAFSSEVPEMVQKTQLEQVLHQLTDSSLLESGRLLLAGATGTVILWLGGHALCHPCMEAVEPQNWYTAVPLIVGTLYAVKKGAPYLYRPLLSTKINIAAIKGLRLIERRFTDRPTTQDTVLANIPHDHPGIEPMTEFISLIRDRQFQTLSRPSAILLLFEDPQKFIAQQEGFLDTLTTDEPLRTKQIIGWITGLLEEQTPLSNLPHTQLFKDFKSLAHTSVEKLPHPDLILIAQYRPQLLNRYPTFLEEAATYKLGNDSIIIYFYKALAQAQDHQN